MQKKIRKGVKIKTTKPYFKKKIMLFLKRKMPYYKKNAFGKLIIIKVKANNIFCTFYDNLKKKIIFSCSASRYKIKVTGKKLKFEISRMLTFFYQDIRAKIKTNKLSVKIVSPKHLRSKVYHLLVHLFSRFVIKKIKQRRYIFCYLKDYKSFNGCRVNKKRRKKRRRNRFFKVT